jgi:Uma2 family endonuclease
MATRQAGASPLERVPPLRNGDRLTQPEFHRRYEAMPAHVRAELVGGVVYVSSPARMPHSAFHLDLSGVLYVYMDATPGVDAGTDATAILDETSEPQPDLTLRILPECGGQSWLNEDQYWCGPPELAIEVAHGTKSLDLGPKKTDYRTSGVIEYLVYSVKDQRLFWFRLKEGTELQPDRNGVYRSVTFPGLWIDEPALVARDSNRLLKTLKRGLSTPEHAAFVKQLAAARRRKRR